MSFGESLQALRKESKVTQEQLASYLGVSAQAVSKWENGSYPEGDLIPRIADYFKVSIDFLYGREGRRDSIEQQVVKELSALWHDESTRAEQEKKYMEKVHRILWALQIGSWRNVVDYYDRPVHDYDSARMSSAISMDEGYSFMRLDRDKDCYVYLHRPEQDKGFETWFRDTTDVRMFFSMLADPDNLKVLTFMYTLAGGELASFTTIQKMTGVPKEKVTAFLDYMTGKLNLSGESAIIEVQLIGPDGNNQKAYGVNTTMGGLFVGIFALADSFVHAPQGYSMQTNCKEHSWVDRTKLSEFK